MTGFLKTLKADLLDRRLLPFVVIASLALVAAIGYVVTGSGSSTPPAPASASVSPVVPSGGIAVTGAVAEKAVAETTDGTAEQRSGKARDPFAAIAGTKTEPAKTTPTATSSGSGSSSGSAGSTTKTTETPAPSKTEESKPKPGTTKKKTTVYHVALEFGLFPPGSTHETVALTPYENLKLQTPLPSAKQPLIVFRGVTGGGKSATFSIIGEAILHGPGSCLPSATQCQAVDLKPGESEQLEFLPSTGTETVVYELRVVSIAAAKASAASVGAAWSTSKAGREILRRAGLTQVPVLRYSGQPGVLVFPLPRAFSARAHVALEHHR